MLMWPFIYGKVYAIMIFALIGELSEREIIRGNSIENRGYLFIYMFGRTYFIFVLRPWHFLC